MELQTSIPAAAKLRAPSRRAETIPRRALVERLSGHQGVALIVAPPGFGKTTLLGQWKERDPRPFAWLSLDAGDNDPVRFWGYVLSALRDVVPDIGRAIESILQLPGATPSAVVVPRLLNELEAIEHEIVLVLDDYHFVTNSICHGSLEELVRQAPSTFTIAISGRADPPVHVASLRVRGDLLELRGADLGFTLQESEEFFNVMLGLELDPRSLAALQERTEGWPAGLYLAALSLRDATDRARFVDAFRGSNRNVVDYLTDVVVSGLDPDTRDFVLATSVLDRLSGSLCDAITGRRDSAELLSALEAANLFLVALDDRREWYRFHRLFRDLLQDELERRQRDRVPELHRRAAEWLAASGDASGAIEHAVSARDFETAATLVGENYLHALETGAVASVARWLEAFPRSMVVADARLSVVEAWVMSFLTRQDESEIALRNALLAGYDGPLPDGASSVEASAALLRAGAPWGDVGGMLAAARRAFELEGARDSMWRITSHVQLGWALSLSGAFAEADPLLTVAAAQAPAFGQWLNAFAANTLLAWNALEDDRVDQAEDWANRAQAIVEEQRWSDLPTAGWSLAALGAAFARWGRTEEANSRLTSGLSRLRGGAHSLILVQVLLALVPVRRALGSIGEARALLAEARALVDACVDPGTYGNRVFELTRSLTPSYQRIGGADSLTERELEVLQLFDKGLSQRQVAATLYLSYNTVHSHARSIYRKLGVFSRPEAIRKGHDLGLL